MKPVVIISILSVIALFNVVLTVSQKPICKEGAFFDDLLGHYVPCDECLKAFYANCHCCPKPCNSTCKPVVCNSTVIYKYIRENVTSLPALDGYSPATFWLTVGLLVLVIVILLALLFYQHYNQGQSQDKPGREIDETPSTSHSTINGDAGSVVIRMFPSEPSKLNSAVSTPDFSSI